MTKKSLFLGLIAGLALGAVLTTTSTQADVVNSSNPKPEIRDNKGNVVPVVAVPKTVKSLRGTGIPHQIKWLSGTQSYTSDPFSGIGTRYSGYSFGNSTGNKFKVTEYIGGFAAEMFTTAAYPENVSYVTNLPLSGSPYTINWSGYLYFAVDNPKNGQKYKIAAMS